MKAIIKEKNYNITKLYYNCQPNIDNVILDLNKFKYLQWIECNYSKVVKMTNICKFVVYIICKSNNITELYDLPSNLNTFNCSYNKITCLDKLPIGLKKLICSENRVSQLNNLPNDLEYLDCSYNPIKDLDNLPLGLIELVCGNKELNNLDYLPDSLKYLKINIYSKNLKLDDLPTGLINVFCCKYLLQRTIIDKNIWKVVSKGLEKKKFIQYDPITFSPIATNLIDGDCENCNGLLVNCICENNSDTRSYLSWDYF